MYRMNTIPLHRRRGAALLCWYLSWLLCVGLAAYLLFFLLVSVMPTSATHRLFDPLAGVAFWGGIPASVALFIGGFFIDERKTSIEMMLLAVVLGLLWLSAAFGSFVVQWGTAHGAQSL